MHFMYKQDYITEKQKRHRDSVPLATGRLRNSEFCFPRISMFPRGGTEGRIKIRGKQN